MLVDCRNTSLLGKIVFLTMNGLIQHIHICRSFQSWTVFASAPSVRWAQKRLSHQMLANMLKRHAWSIYLYLYISSNTAGWLYGSERVISKSSICQSQCKKHTDRCENSNLISSLNSSHYFISPRTQTFLGPQHSSGWLSIRWIQFPKKEIQLARFLTLCAIQRKEIHK